MPKRDIESEPVDEELGRSRTFQRSASGSARRGKRRSSASRTSRRRPASRSGISKASKLREWDKLPAPTYTIGFAKSYASAVGLDRTEIGDQLREEMGGQRFANSHSEVIEAADPARTMPKWLVIGAVVAVILLVVLMTWLNSRSLEQPGSCGEQCRGRARRAAPRRRACACRRCAGRS